MKTLRRIFNVLLIGVIICMLMTMFSTHETTRKNIDTTDEYNKIVLHDSTERRNRRTGEVEYEDHLYEDRRDERVTIEHTDDGWVWDFIGKDE